MDFELWILDFILPSTTYHLKILDFILPSTTYHLKAIFLALLLLVLSSCSPQQVTPTPTSEPETRKAVLVDQIALTNPKPGFTDQTLSYLKEAGFSVDVYAGEEVTIEFYRTLPTKGYKLILIRTHATNILNENIPGGPVFLFTSEIYDKNRYVKEQLTNRIGRARLLYDDNSPLYFAIVSGFVRQDMTGRFDNTLIILGGCQSLGTPDLAQAFIDRGAAAVVGWNEWVDLHHNDQALLHLLHGLTAEKLTLEQAIRKTMNEIGPDPAYGSILTYLSEKGGAFTLWNY
ncbi:MAG: hypothetical protein FJ014_15050 [Chloroflexi bacterium]|nr:hypothetical protein [Chloroflexota bacterium]